MLRRRRAPSTVDGRSLDEPYIYEPIEFIPGSAGLHHRRQMSRRCFGPVTVPDGRAVGDGRSPVGLGGLLLPVPGPAGQPAAPICQGPIPVDNVIGKAIFIVMPPSRWGTIGNPDIDPGNPAN